MVLELWVRVEMVAWFGPVCYPLVGKKTDRWTSPSNRALEIINDDEFQRRLEASAPLLNFAHCCYSWLELQ